MVLVERERHLTQLSALLERCLDGAGSVVVLRGPVAVGRTELLHTFAERVAGPRVRFLGAAASPEERQLPFGLLSQLLHGAGAAYAERAEALIGRPGQPEGEAGPQVLEGVARILLDMSAEDPLLLGVDDVSHADTDSLRCLLFLARRLRRARVMLVLSDQDGSGSRHADVRGELSRLPYCTQIRLDPLSCDGVAALLAHDLDAHVAHSLAAGAFAVTGGNPLLVRALAEDWEAHARAAGAEPPTALVVGDRFAERAVSCLHRFGPDALAVARAVAVIGEAPDADLVARLTGLGAIETRALLELLGTSGLLREGRYRHPVAQAAVLGDFGAAGRVAWHRSAAALLHADGGPPVSVALQLIAAGDTDEPWAPAVLQESAARATAGGQVDFAVDCLELAHTLADDEQQRAVSRAVLAEAEWRLDPARVVRHLGQLTDALHRGHLTGRQSLSVLEHLLWHGRVDEAATALDRLARAESGPDAAELGAVRACLELCYPAQRHHRTTRAPALVRTPPPGSAPSLVATVLAAVRGEGAVSGDHLWQGLRTDEPLTRIALGLLALARPERLATVAPWCLPVLADAAGHEGPDWRGLVTAARADAALLRGELPAAGTFAAEALAESSAASWGVLAGAPLACLLVTAVETGRLEEAAAQLNVPLPAALMETPFGLRYLRARGQYHLAIDRPYAALSDFRACGRLLRDWAADGPRQLPWRIDAAQAMVRLGRRAEARALLEEQLDGLPVDDERTLGRALRQLAATLEPHERPPLLGDAVEALQAAGDRVELAHALADLGNAHAAAGDSRRARPVLRRAWRAARECHAERLARALRPGAASTPSAGAASGGPGRSGGPRASGGVLGGEQAAELSAAERRVGGLAARGHSNRQIAQRLCITVSTVEQHLTQVYRKLGVRSRTDLPGFLEDEEESSGVNSTAGSPRTDPLLADAFSHSSPYSP
ncbi:helix-turn-helix transcriptional regulator [Streptomyces venezuelae]|uniref:helix-turn-helix transcriptional regulator n=1 Tax=Streptomyces venezuelae TaxID=54571 RepID=UPI00123A1214|nr:LuxR family transcriptional regulator [Streptomyces venezuelae]QES04555.1 helix-turn-helix transcriptional regulator [Streptomyces venezuelae]